MTDVVDLVSELVRIPSVSPFGKNERERRERFRACKEAIDGLAGILEQNGARTEKLVFEGGHARWG